jgi:hypothetical protein
VDDVGVTQDGENAPAAAVKEQTNCEASVSQGRVAVSVDERKDDSIEEGRDLASIL